MRRLAMRVQEFDVVRPFYRLNRTREREGLGEAVYGCSVH